MARMARLATLEKFFSVDKSARAAKSTERRKWPEWESG